MHGLLWYHILNHFGRRAFTRTSLDFLITVLTAVIDLLSFSAILFQIFPGLFLAIIFYAGIGSLITTNLGQSLVGLNYERLQKEADFRFALVRNRENAEAIAFYDPDATIEKQHLLGLFKEALGAQLGIITTQRNLEAFTTSYKFLVQILPSLIVAPLYFKHQIEFGSISQSYGAFNHILGDFSLIINQFEAISAFSAGLTRLNSFLETISLGGWNQSAAISSMGNAAISEISEKPPYIQMSQRLSKGDPIIAHCRNLTVFTPDRSRVLVGSIKTGGGLRGIDFNIAKGDRVLIVGNSGAGKSTLIRALAGLWQIGHGDIEWTVSSEDLTSSDRPPSGVFFMPQRPYNLLGTLAEQIMYPTVGPQASSEDLLQILQRVRLPDLAQRSGGGDPIKGLNVTMDWSKVKTFEFQRSSASSLSRCFP